MTAPRFSAFQVRTPGTKPRVVLEDLADAPVDLAQDFDVPEAFLSEGRPDDVVAAELADPEVQSILRAAGLD